MDSETFILRKQFLEEFYNEERVGFLRACEFIDIRNSFLNSIGNRIFCFETEPIFKYRIKNMFKTFCNLLKPFVYFLYSITYYKNFLPNHLLFFDKLEIRYCKKMENDEMERLTDMNDLTVYFTISNGIRLNRFLEPVSKNFNFLKTIKIKDFFNESIKELAYLNIRLNTKYVDIDNLEYIRLGGIGIENHISYNIERIINSSQTFKSEECVICLTNPPQVLFCNCGHIPFCSECEKLKTSNKCPICKTENDIIRMLE